MVLIHAHSLSPCDRRENWGIEVVSNWPKVTSKWHSQNLNPGNLASLPSNAACSKRRETVEWHAQGRPNKGRTEKKGFTWTETEMDANGFSFSKKLKSEKNTGSADSKSNTLNANPVADRIMTPLNHPSPHPWNLWIPYYMWQKGLHRCEWGLWQKLSWVIQKGTI